MSQSLDEVKARIAQKYLGVAGIHGVGVSQTHNAVRVYLTPEAGSEQAVVLAALRRDAVPYDVLIVEAEPPQITAG
jgi:hypothetical protein